MADFMLVRNVMFIADFIYMDPFGRRLAGKPLQGAVAANHLVVSSLLRHGVVVGVGLDSSGPEEERAQRLYISIT